MKSLPRKKLKYLINIVLLFTAVVFYFGVKAIPQSKTGPVKNDQFYYVSRVVDGDTIKLSSGENVRLLGIDTPESRYNNKLERDATRSRKDMNIILKMGRQSSNFTKKLVEGKSVRLEFDVQKRDKYGRLLAYVYLEDGTFVNAEIIKEGYAQVMTIPPNVRKADFFLKLERDARESGKGLWKESAGKNLF